MEEAAVGTGRAEALESVRKAKHFRAPTFAATSWTQPLLDYLSESRDSDVRYGAYFMRAYAHHAGWLLRIRAADVRAHEIERYFDERVPGLHEALLNTI
jgi:hypothetical protein